MTTNQQPDEIDTFLEKAMHWSGFYDEAKANMPPEVRNFIEQTSWAGELFEAERRKLAKQAIQRILLEARIDLIKEQHIHGFVSDDYAAAAIAMGEADIKALEVSE